MKKLTLIVAALALMMGFSQCKKDNLTPNDNRIQITLNANYCGAKTTFDPVGGTFAWNTSATEYINVGGSSSGYLGQLDNSAAKGTGTFTGTLDKNPIDNENLYFFYLGNGSRPDARTLSFSNQDGTLANLTNCYVAISDGVKYTGQTDFSAELKMKIAIAYLNTSVFAGEYVYLTGDDIYSNVVVNYRYGTITPYEKSYVKCGSANDGVYIALVPSTESETTLKFESNSKTGSEITFLRGIKEGSYYSNSGDALTIPTPIEVTGTDAIKGLFSVSDSKMVRFSRGNLLFTRESTDDDWSTGSWSFMTNQYDVVETANVSADYASETAIGLFGWGTSGYNARNTETNYYYKPFQTNSDNGSYYGPASNTSLIDTYSNCDWGVYNSTSITNGGGYDTWRVLSNAEWQYVLNQRSASTINNTDNARYVKVTVGSMRGIIMFPDGYTHPNDVKAPTNINPGYLYTWQSFTVEEFNKMANNGAVFLPAAGYRVSGTTIDYYNNTCYYWTSTSSSTTDAYRLYIANGSVTFNNNVKRYLGCSVRLVRE